MRFRPVAVLLGLFAAGSAWLLAQSPVASCDATPAPAWCSAVAGDRSAGVGFTAPLGGDGAQRHGRDEPAARGAGRPRHPEEGRQRDRRRGRDRRGAERRRADERRPGRRPLRDRLHREGEQALRAERQRQGAERTDAGADERARLRLGLGELGAGLRDAAGRHSDGDGARRRVGLGRSAASLRHADRSRRRCSQPSTMRSRAFPSPSASRTTGASERAAARRQAIRASAARSSIPIRSRRGTSTASHRPPGRSSAIPDLARTFRILQQKGRDGFYKGEIAQRHRREVDARSAAR